MKQMIKDLLLWIYWHPVKHLVQRLPAGWLYGLGSFLGAFLYLAARGKRRAFSKEALLIAGRGQRTENIRKNVLETFRVWLWQELEVLVYPRLSPANIESFCGIEGLDHLDRALAKGNGALLVFAHFGANQMVMPAMGHRGYPMSQLSAPATIWQDVLQSRRFSQMEVKAMQYRWDHELALPVEHINIFGSIKRMVKCVKANHILGLAMDGGGGKEKIEVPFLGRKANFSMGAAQIARRYGCAMLPVFVVREPGGRNRMIIEPPLSALPGLAEDAAVADMTRRFVARLQMYVHAFPSHYIRFLALRRFMADKEEIPLFTVDMN